MNILLLVIVMIKINYQLVSTFAWVYIIILLFWTSVNVIYFLYTSSNPCANKINVEKTNLTVPFRTKYLLPDVLKSLQFKFSTHAVIVVVVVNAQFFFQYHRFICLFWNELFWYPNVVAMKSHHRESVT